MLTAFITGIGIDVWLFLLRDLITPEIWYSKMIYFGIGLVITGLGTAIYLQTNFAPIPIDRLTLIIQKLTRTNIFIARTFIYLIFLIMATILHGPIGVGTILTVCLGGLLLNFFIPLTKKVIDHLFVHQSTSSSYKKNKAADHNDNKSIF